MEETEEEKKARLKKSQAEAHRRWRLGPKGQAYKVKQIRKKEAEEAVQVNEQCK